MLILLTLSLAQISELVDREPKFNIFFSYFGAFARAL
jgi:hypothetical protein